MATPNVGILTNSGKNLIDQVNAGKTKITFSKIVFSSMNNNQLTDDQIKALTTIAPQEIVVNNPKVTLDNNTGETRIRATGNNEALTDGVYVKTYAVYAKDDSGDEILYGITVSPNPNYLPEYDGVTPQAVTYSYKVNINNTSNITFTNSNDIYVSDTDLAEALQPYAKTVDVNQQLDKKVVDNKDGTEQLNGVQVQPFNKLSDTIGGRNLLVGTSGTLQTVTNATGWGNNFANINTNRTDLTNGTYTARVYISPVSHSAAVYLAFNSTSGGRWPNVMGTVIPAGSSGYSVCTYTVPSGFYVANVFVSFINSYTDSTQVSWKEMYLKKGSIATDWTPAPEDKVNVADTSNWQKNKVTNDDGTPLIKLTSSNQDLSATLMSFGLGLHTVYASGSVQNNPFSGTSSAKGVIDIQGNATGKNAFGEGFLIGSHNSVTSMYYVWLDGSNAHYTQIANDSTVVHNTGNEEIAGTKTFDTAPIDKTTGNPYITKDGVPAVPSTLADTTKPANFTAGLQSGGVDVATAADLNNYYHANSSDDAALAAAKAATVPGIFWFEEA